MRRGIITALILVTLSTPAPASGVEGFVLVLKPSAADPGAVARRLAATYGGTLEVEGQDWIIRISPARARLLAADAHVSSLQPIGAANISAPLETVSWSSGVSYKYDSSGNIRQIGQDTFGYDTAGRLVQAEVNRFTQKYEYDPFGNRTRCMQTSAGAGRSDCQWSHTIDGTSNRIEQARYDENGNVTELAGNRYSYDALDMMTRAQFGDTREFIYTAEDERVGTWSASSRSWVWTIRDTSGRILSEFTSEGGPDGVGSWHWSKDYIWRDGLLLASKQTTGTTTTTWHYHLDHLGSPRRITDDKDKLVGFHDYHAFGPEVTGFDEQPLTKLKFTGHERDLQSNFLGTLDYMHARFYNPNLGRFLSVDPVITKAALRAPQLWNRYAYVGNNPINMVDPDGRVLTLSGCANNTNSGACKSQFNLYLSTFGKKSADAAKYLSVGKGGVVSFKGISGAAFGARFGMMGRATNYLVSNRSATFSLVTGASAQTARSGGAFFEPTKVSTLFHGTAMPGGGTIGIDPSAFPINRGTISLSATEALAHEVGHAVGSLLQGFRDAIDTRLGGAATRTPWTMNEGYSMAWENRWRVEVLGVPPNDLRMFYNTAGDVLHDSGAQLYP